MPVVFTDYSYQFGYGLQPHIYVRGDGIGRGFGFGRYNGNGQGCSFWGLSSGNGGFSGPDTGATEAVCANAVNTSGEGPIIWSLIRCL